MKKLLSVLLVVLLTLALVGCSKKYTAKSLVGAYEDSTSQRAVAAVEVVDENTVNIDISWGSSASEHDEWIIKAKIDGDKLNYEVSDFTHFRVEGETTTEVEGEPAGYFEIKDGKLAWTGSGVENTSNCVFEKVS